MIRFILLQNKAGKTRLAKYYVPMNDAEKHKLEYDVHRLVAARDPKHTNFVEVRARLGSLAWALGRGRTAWARGRMGAGGRGRRTSRSTDRHHPAGGPVRGNLCSRCAAAQLRSHLEPPRSRASSPLASRAEPLA